LWQDCWRNHSAEAVVLNEYHAREHPYYKYYNQDIARLPSVNPGSYDRSCFMRWLAVASAAKPAETAVMCDYDVMSYGFTTRRAQMGILRLHEPSGVPCLVSAQGSVFEKVCKVFAGYIPDDKDVHDGRPHVSDMTILHRLLSENEAQTRLMRVLRECLEFGSPGWEFAAAVHYSNASMGSKGLKPKWKHIPTLRAWTTSAGDAEQTNPALSTTT